MVSLHVTWGFLDSAGGAAAPEAPIAAGIPDDEPMPKPLYDLGKVAGPKSQEPKA